MVITDVGDYTVVVGKEPDEDKDFIAIQNKWGHQSIHLFHVNLDDRPLWCRKVVYTPEFIVIYFEEEKPPSYKTGDRVGIIAGAALICNPDIYKLYEDEMNMAFKCWLADNIGIVMCNMAEDEKFSNNGL
jgi:hypothetical protein